MTKWLITRANKRGAKWQLVEFGGKTGSESYGIVDLMAIRKDHRPANQSQMRGDFFEIVLIQVKGGSARFPTHNDIQRLRCVAKHHKARAIILAEWKKAKALQIHLLDKSGWKPIPAEEIFG